MAAPRQNEIKVKATVVATTTLAVEADLLLASLGGAGSVDILRTVDRARKRRPPIRYSTPVRGLTGESAERALRLAAALRAAGHQALLVGGCVRDLLLGLPPKDFDIATDAVPARLLALFPNADQVGAHFGVVLVDGVEIATFRADGVYTDGRHPETVRFETSPAADAARRDFSINGLFFDPVTERVLDFVGGERDLRAGVIRAIGQAADRLAEDHLRMLRAVRFAARFGFAIEAETMAAIQAQAPAIHRMAAERAKDELNRILTQGGARRGLELLDESGLLLQLLPEISALKGVQQPLEFHPEGDVWTHVLLMLEKMQSPSVTLAWGVLLHDVAKPPTFRMADRIRFDGHAELGARMAREILWRLKQSNDVIDLVVDLVARHMDWMNIQQMRPATLKRFLRRDHFAEHHELHRLDCLGSHGRLDHYEFSRRRLAELPPEALRPLPLIDGDDLIAAGLTPGPAFKRILTWLEDAQLEGRVTTREQALLALSDWKEKEEPA